MDEELGRKLQATQLELGKQAMALAGQIAELRASVTVLMLYLSHQVLPGNPLPAFQELQRLSKMLLEADSSEKARRETLAALELLETWHKRGGPSGHS